MRHCGMDRVLWLAGQEERLLLLIAMPKPTAVLHAMYCFDLSSELFRLSETGSRLYLPSDYVLLQSSPDVGACTPYASGLRIVVVSLGKQFHLNMSRMLYPDTSC